MANDIKDAGRYFDLDQFGMVLVRTDEEYGKNAPCRLGWGGGRGREKTLDTNINNIHHESKRVKRIAIVL